ncbi:MAG: outer membrane beta-barrel protein [Muribaculaceae bacterium]|nr:outer membrane beta-barrel protein [Muribaculaceae bacterium]
MIKKIFAPILVMVILCGAVSAEARMRWGVTVGPSVSTLKFKQNLVDVKQVLTYTGGVTGEVIFPGIGIGVDIGLLYDQQGALVDLGSKLVWSSLGYGNEHVYIHNLKIPVHLRWKYTNLNGIEEKIAPIIYGGPEFDIQIGHGHCDAFKYSGGDLGLTVGIGAELWRKWQITAGYTWGMTYVLKTKLLDQFSAQSRQWTVRLSYYF